MSTSQVLQHLCALDKSSPEFVRALHTFIRLDENGECSLNLQHSESARLADFLDGALDVIPVTDALFRRCLRRLRHICGHHNVLPSSHIISDGLRKTSGGPVAYGGFADVWEGALGDEKVCVKVLRMYNVNKSNQKGPLVSFHGEAVVWKRLRHPNVVPFLGVTTTPLQLVSKWMPNGTLTEYVNVNPDADRISLLLDVAEGVNYLHTCHMFHGDLKGPNILIDGNGHACVSDFGLASIAHGKYSTGVKSDKGHTVRWSAPEILFGNVPASKQADMFAFGMVVIEAFTGNVPFQNVVSTAVTYKVMNGERPSRPQGVEKLGLTDALWKMTEYCWKHPPKDRLKSSEVVDLLREIYVGSPSNSFTRAIDGIRGLVWAGSVIPQTDAALSPMLLEILQYREPAHKRTMSDTALKEDRRTVVDNLPDRPASTVGHQTTKQHAADGIMQRLGATDHVRNGPPIPSPPKRSQTADAVETEVFWPASPTKPHQENLNQVHKSEETTLNPSESPVAVPKISIQTGDSVPSNASSFTAVDSSEYQHLIPAGSTRTDRRTRGARNNDDAARNDHGASDSGNNLGDGGVRKVSDASSRRTEPQHGPPEQLAPALSPTQIGQTPSWSGSVRKKGLGGFLATLGRGDGGSRHSGGGGSKPSTRPTTPIAERGGNAKGQGRGGESRPSDPLPQQTGASKKGLGGWGRVRVMAKVLGLHNRHHSQSNETEE